MAGFPRKFESQQDYAIAHRIKSSIEKARDYYAEQLQPPSVQQIAVSVELLDVRGFQKPLPLDDNGEVLEDVVDQINKEWVDDLKEFPADLVELACRRWRRANNNRPPYASGELMESVKAEHIRRKSIFMKAESVLGLIA